MTAERCYHGGMRIAAALAAIALAGCFPEGTYECDLDGDCSAGEVCARTHECVLPSEVRAVNVRWAIEGQLDTQTGCRNVGLRDLEIEFSGAGQDLRFAPVPCQGGSYFIDKLPSSYSTVQLTGTASGGVPYYASGSIVGTTELALTLAPF